MRRALATLLAGAAAAFAGAAQAQTFTVVSGPAALPSATTPNAPGGIAVPMDLSAPPAQPAVLSYQQLLDLWRAAGEAYDVPWPVLAAINEVETDFGRGMDVSSAGAVGWMQFMPQTWQSWGVDASGDGIADPWNPTDAVYSAARYLAAAGAHEDLRRAIFAYNHADWYVERVLAGAARFGADPAGGAFLLAVLGLGAETDQGPGVEEQIAAARDRVTELSARVNNLETEVEQGGWDLGAAEREAGDPALSQEAFAAAESSVEQLAAQQAGLEAELAQARQDLDAAAADVTRLEQELAALSAAPGQSLDGYLPTPPTAAAAAVIDRAVGELGVPYVWGGNHGFSLADMQALEPDLTRGFDCSSLLAWSFAKGAGLYIGDWTVTQWEYGASALGATRGDGPAQGGADPEGGYLPGDIIFFDATDHVALYLGNDLFVHAPHTGDVVRIARLSEYGQVWGWVRYAQISGIGDAPATAAERVFDVVATPTDATVPSAETPTARPAGSAIITFTR